MVAGVVLFVCYLRVSGTQPISSDGGSNALEAWDMLHGNLLLHGWTLTDVSFYTTELPEYMAVELVRGLSPAVVHTAAAFTYTLLVLLAGLLAKGRATGREGVARVLIGSGIMLAPQLGNSVFVLLGVPDHVGTGVPLLLIFLVLDRAPRRWYVPPVIGLMLAWATVADRLVIDVAILPIVIVCAVRIFQGVVRAGRPLAALWFEVSLIAASIAALGISLLVLRILGHLGGFILLPLNTQPGPRRRAGQQLPADRGGPALAVRGQLREHARWPADGPRAAAPGRPGPGRVGPRPRAAAFLPRR